MNSQPDPHPPADLALPPFSFSRALLRPALLIIMTLAVIGAILSVLRQFNPERPWLIALPLCLFIALESYATTVWLTQPQRRLLNHVQYRAAELIVIILLVRLVAWITQGNWPQPALWATYLSNPLLLINDIFFLGLLGLALIAWYRVISTSAVFSQLAPDAAEKAYYAIPRHERPEGNLPQPLNRDALRHLFAQQFLGGAVLLLLCAAFVSVDEETFNRLTNLLNIGLGQLSLPPGLLLSMLIYFLAGFLLLSQGRLAALEARWLAQDAIRSPGVGRVWWRRSLIILLLIGVGAAFLPIGSTLPFTMLLNALIYAGTMALGTLVYLVSLLVYFLFTLFGPEPTAQEPLPATPPPPFLPPESMPPAEPSPLLQLIATSAFWALAIVLSIAAVNFFLRERGMGVNSNMVRQLWWALRQWWRNLWRGASERMVELRLARASRQKKEEKEENGRPPWRFIRLNALSPQELVRYFYLSTVKRAEKEGVPRRQSETPKEFAADLKENWPEADAEVDTLTEAFLQARYSRQPVEEEAIPPLKAQWRQAKARLRRHQARRRASNSEDDAPEDK